MVESAARVAAMVVATCSAHVWAGLWGQLPLVNGGAEEGLNGWEVVTRNPGDVISIASDGHTGNASFRFTSPGRTTGNPGWWFPQHDSLRQTLDVSAWASYIDDGTTVGRFRVGWSFWTKVNGDDGDGLSADGPTVVLIPLDANGDYIHYGPPGGPDGPYFLAMTGTHPPWYGLPFDDWYSNEQAGNIGAIWWLAMPVGTRYVQVEILGEGEFGPVYEDKRIPPDGGAFDVQIDDVVLYWATGSSGEQIPEPATFLVLLMGLVTTVARGRRHGNRGGSTASGS